MAKKKETEECNHDVAELDLASGNGELSLVVAKLNELIRATK